MILGSWPVILPEVFMHATRRCFHIGDVLTLIMNYDVSLRGEDGFRAITDYMAGRALSPEEREEIGPQLIAWARRQFPLLCTFTEKDLPPRELLDEWLLRRAREFNEYLEVRPLAEAAGPAALDIAAGVLGERTTPDHPIPDRPGARDA